MRGEECHVGVTETGGSLLGWHSWKITIFFIWHAGLLSFEESESAEQLQMLFLRRVVCKLIKLDRHCSEAYLYKHPFGKMKDQWPSGQRPQILVVVFCLSFYLPLMHPLPCYAIAVGGNWSACMSNYKTMEWKISGERGSSSIVHMKGLSHTDRKSKHGWNHSKTLHTVTPGSSTVSSND